MANPRVTVVIPVRNEAGRLDDCLAALAAQDLPAAFVEGLVVDGGSTDGTVDDAERLLSGPGWWRPRILHSPAGDRSSNLNVGLAAASAPIVVRVDARSRVPRHYLRRCMLLLDSRPDVAVVGGRQRAIAAGRRPLDVGVARALNNRWGMGLARYRRAGTSGIADTVYLGAYRSAQLRAAGGWRTDLAVNEDFDLNRRLRRQGVVWFDADLTVAYVPRSSIPGLLRQYWDFGTGKARYWRLSGDRPRPRQVLLLTAPVVALGVTAAASLRFGPGPAAALLGCGLALVGVGEVLGADGPPGGVAAHLAAVFALGCVASAWWAGVAIGFLHPAPTTVAVLHPEEAAA